jgi:hypothetical protein
MTALAIFQLHLSLGYLPWLLVMGAYVWPRLGSMDRVAVHRAFAALHSFRFFGLVFLVPGVVGPDLPPGFAAFAAYGDFATGILAMLAVMAAGRQPLFWSLVVAFNVVGAVDIVVDYMHGAQLGLAPGQLGAAYGIVIIYVPLLLITHVTAFVLLLRQTRRAGIPSGQRAGIAR